MGYGQRSFSELIGGYVTPCMGIFLIIFVILAVGFISLFVIHSIFIWLSTDPEKAFHNARVVTAIVGQGWDGVGFVWNIGMTGLESFVADWNLLAKHAIEPVINIALEVLTQIAFQKHYEGIITDSPDSLPFRGHYCAEPTVTGNTVTGYDVSTMDMQSLEFCSYGTVDHWAAQLDASTESDPSNVISNGSTLLLSTQHARKLAAKFKVGKKSKPGSSEGMFPRMPLGPLLGALQAFVGLQALLSTTAFDIGMHVAYTILSEMAVLIFNMLQALVKAFISFVQVIFRSGILQSLLRMGVDLIIALVTHVLLPLLFAFLDIFMCTMGYFRPATWDSQLMCSTCLP